MRSLTPSCAASCGIVGGADNCLRMAATAAIAVRSVLLASGPLTPDGSLPPDTAVWLST